MNTKKKFFGYKAAFGSFLVIFCVMGIGNTFGVFLSSLTEYSEHTVSAVGQIATFSTIAMVIFSLVAVKAFEKIGMKWSLFIAIIAIAGHTQLYCMVTPGANPQSLAFMYSAGVVAALGVAFGTHAACSVVIGQWFIDKREKVSGIVFSGAGFGAAFWVFLAGQMFSITNYKNSYRVLAVLCIIIGLFAVFVLIRTPESMGQKPYELPKTEILKETSDVQTAESPSVTKSQALKSPSFWILAAAIFLTAMSGCTYLSFSPTWWSMHGMSSTMAANWTAIYLVLAGLAVMVVGSIFKKLGPSLFTVYVIVTFSISLVFLIIYGMTPGTLIMFGTVVFGALGYPIMASIPGLITQSVFGQKHFAVISATMMTAVYAGQALSAPVMSFFLEAFGSMESAWIFTFIVSLIGMVLILISIRISPVRSKSKSVSQYNNVGVENQGEM